MSKSNSFYFQERANPLLQSSYFYATQDQLDSVLIKLQKGEPLSWYQRRNRLEQLKFNLQANLPDLTDLLTKTMGKPILESKAEIQKSIAAIDYVLSQDETVLKDQSSDVTWHSVGVVLAIEPWNFPCWQLFRFLPWVICAGGVVLHKGSERVAPFVEFLNQIIEASLGQELFKGIWLNHAQINNLIADSRIGGVTLTGSVAAGRAVAQQAGCYFKPCILELGGSDPFIVGTHGDLSWIAQQAVKSRLLNNGQSCIAAKRFIVPQVLTTQFINCLITELQSLSMGEAIDSVHQMTGLIDEQAVQELHKQVKLFVEQGAELIKWSAPLLWPSETGYWCYPVILKVTGREPSYSLHEFFGPVFQVVSYTNLEEAISLANQSHFGLAASFWGFSSDENKILSAQVKCGTVSINQIVKSDPQRPFGGIKNSGWGAEMGLVGFRNFSYPKVIVK